MVPLVLRRNRRGRKGKERKEIKKEKKKKGSLSRNIPDTLIMGFELSDCVKK